MAVDGKYVIAMYAIKPIRYGEELTFDYSCVTEDQDEFKNAICLCGSPKCRGSFLTYSGAGAFATVLHSQHHFLARQAIIYRASADRALAPDEHAILKRHGFEPSSKPREGPSAVDTKMDRSRPLVR